MFYFGRFFEALLNIFIKLKHLENATLGYFNVLKFKFEKFLNDIEHSSSNIELITFEGKFQEEDYFQIERLYF